MINAIKKQPPAIRHFYANDTFEVGDSIKIWLTGQYNEDVYIYNVTAEGDYTVTATSVFEYDFVFNEVGTFTISCNISHKVK